MTEPNPSMLPPAAYVNFLRVAQQQGEFFLSFGQVAQGQNAAAHLVASLVTSPAQAKTMARALAESVRRYEEHHGEIPVPQAATGAPEGRAPRRPSAKPAPAKGSKTQSG